MDYVTNNYKETEELGKEIAKKVKDEKTKPVIICLKGNLGGGKTTFLKGFARGLKIKEVINSPTFLIFKKIDIPESNQKFFHFDCYRVKKEKELIDLGFKKIIKDKKNIIAIEWPEKIKNIIPNKYILIKFKFINENQRKIEINIKSKITNPK